MININKDNIFAIILIISVYVVGFYNSDQIVSLFFTIDNPIGIIITFNMLFILGFLLIPFAFFIFAWIKWHFLYLNYETTKIKCPIQITSQNLRTRKEIPDPCCQKFGKKLLKKLSPIGYFIIDGFAYYLFYSTIYFGKTSKDFIDNHSEWHAECLHNGIVICPSRGSVESYYSYGPEDLTEYFLTNHIPYKIYACNTVEDFKSLVKNDSIGVLWLFGHGNLGGFAVTNKDVVKYYEFETEEYQNHKKIAVYQLHCNSKFPESPYPLSKILVDGWDFREKDRHTNLTIKAYIRYIISHHTLFPGIWESVN